MVSITSDRDTRVKRDAAGNFSSRTVKRFREGIINMVVALINKLTAPKRWRCSSAGGLAFTSRAEVHAVVYALDASYIGKGLIKESCESSRNFRQACVACSFRVRVKEE